MSRYHKSNYHHHKHHYKQPEDEDGYEKAKRIAKGTGKFIGEVAGGIKEGVVAGYKVLSHPKTQQYFRDTEESLRRRLPPSYDFNQRVEAARDEIYDTISQGKTVYSTYLVNKYQLPINVISNIILDTGSEVVRANRDADISEIPNKRKYIIENQNKRYRENLQEEKIQRLFAENQRIAAELKRSGSRTNLLPTLVNTLPPKQYSKPTPSSFKKRKGKMRVSVPTQRQYSKPLNFGWGGF
jgi:hypothetical protein